MTSYEAFFHPHLASLVPDLPDRLLPAPYVRIETPAQVEMAVVRQGGDPIVHPINHRGKEILADGWLPITEHIPQISGIKMSIQRRKPGCVVVSAPDGEVMEGIRPEGCLSFTVPSLGIMRSFRAKDWFAARG